MKIPVDNDSLFLSELFEKNGHSLFLVGGSVRDILLKREVHDRDYATDATPQEIKSFYSKTVDTGIEHGTLSLLLNGRTYEVTTFRTDGEYADRRHPVSVTFVKELKEDLKRRDYTINAIAASLPGGEIIDFEKGRRDLRRKVVRAIGNAEERFKEDALRMMRGVRISAELGFKIEKKTFAAIEKMSGTIKNVSPERIREELFRTMGSPGGSEGIEKMRKSGLLHHIIPELEECYGFYQGGFHSEDLYTHLLLSLSNATKYNYPLSVKIASLFHDIGKIETREEGEKREYTFYSHEKVSKEKTVAILKRLKVPNRLIDEVSLLIENHMFSYSSLWSDAAVRRFIIKVGYENIDKLFMLRTAESEAILPFRKANTALLAELRERIEMEMDKKNALSLKDLLIDGNTLLDIGFERGPLIGETLRKLLQEVIDNPEKNSKEYLKERALALLKDR